MTWFFVSICVFCMHAAPALKSGSQQAVPQNVARSPVEDLAIRYSSEQCRSMLSELDVNKWTGIVSPYDDLQHSQQVMQITIGNSSIAYVRNQKVGSKFLWWKLEDVIGEPDSVIKSNFPFDVRMLNIGESVETGFVFTVVRDPLRALVSGYIEVNRRHHLETPKPAYLSMQCGTRKQNSERFAAFLNSVLAGQALGNQAYHVFPQALKIDVAIRQSNQQFDAIGRLESFDEDMTTILSLSGHLPPGQTFDSSEYETPGDAHSHQQDPCADIDLHDRQLKDVICKLYMVDYVCFGYDKNDICQS